MPSLNDFASKRGWYLGKRSTPAHVWLYRRSGGRLGGHYPGRKECRVALVDHKGAKSGVTRTSPMFYLADGSNIAVVASKAGQPTHPAWFHNLMANPETTVQIGREVREVRARLADDAERELLWPQLTAMFPPYEIYERNASPRRLPIVILEPRHSSVQSVHRDAA
jgi:deazaflavin-dependent oxidoreductase (nitroreductase family)